MYDPISKRHIIITDYCLSEMNNKKELTLTERELADVLRLYNLRDGLITLGNYSRETFIRRKAAKQLLGKSGYVDESGVFVTQFALSYLANILLISGANDWKKKLISDRENVLLLLNMYSNLLVSRTPSEESIGSRGEKLASLLVRMSFEQFECQFEPVSVVSRNMILFLEIAPKCVLKSFCDLNSIFLAETGLTIKEYFIYSLFIFACVFETPLFSKEKLVNAQIVGYEDYFKEGNVDKYLKLTSVDYKDLKSLDIKLNKRLNPLDTRNRYNPLNIFPIIKTDKIEDYSPYVIPNIINFVFKGFEGIYWWFDNYFQSVGKLKDYRSYFGLLFEAYVGLVLRDIYGEDEVKPEINYNGGKFIDWYIEKEEKVYLFEVKAKQFSLTVLQTGDIELIKKEVKEKLVEAVKQVYKRILEINLYDELKIFRGKKIIPIIVFLDIPLVSSGGYKEIISEELMILDQGDQYRGISNFDYNLLNIDELEDYSYVVDQTEIEYIFNTIKSDVTKGFKTEVFNIIGWQKIKKNLVDRRFDEFIKEIGVGPVD